jgi:signal transduction histidine kinase
VIDGQLFSWSLNDLFLLCSILLLVLGLLLISSRRNFLTWQFFFATLGLSCWNFCLFALAEPGFAPYVSLIARVQLMAVLVFGNGLFFFCSSFPQYQPNIWHKVSSVVFVAFTGLLLFSRIVTDAVISDGEVAFRDGAGFGAYVAYICVLAILIVTYLVRAWRLYPELRSKTRYFIAAAVLFVGTGSIFNLIFPLFSHYEFLWVGRLSGTFTALLFFYAIVKHEFLDISIIINRYVAWVVTLWLLSSVALLIRQLTWNVEPWASMAVVASAAVVALVARPLQQFLLTTAKRKFIKGWYESEEVFLRLGTIITQETNRENIFRAVLDTLDSVFEVESTVGIVAARLGNQLDGYKVLGAFEKLPSTDPVIRFATEQYEASLVDAAGVEVQARIAALQHKARGRGLIIPFHSPESLEGILVLGAKSSGADYSDTDLVFFNSLINYMAPLLYRLTPIETLEKLYNDNQRRLHEAEIQLVRAQKIEAIVHATRQCHHEIRTPLNIIKLGLGRVKTVEELENYKSIALEEINHAIEIVEETLAISDMNQPVDQNQGEVQINDVISRCLRLVDLSRYQLNQQLQDLPTIQGVASDLQVVLTNLLHNAMEAMPEGGSLYVASEQVGKAIVINVEDTGPGIPDEIRARVWEPYFSGRGAVDGIGNSTAGRGWGLTIVNRIITEHGGTIQFSSQVNVGTKFTIVLPIT